jgi:hypothetical protein
MLDGALFELGDANEGSIKKLRAQLSLHNLKWLGFASELRSIERTKPWVDFLDSKDSGLLIQKSNESHHCSLNE